MNKVVTEDLEYILNNLSVSERDRFKSASILLTGCAGFLGYYITHFFCHFAEELGVKRIIGIDSFLVGEPQWLRKVAEENALLELHQASITDVNLEEIVGNKPLHFVIHMASVASPTFYRKFPLETVDANIWGLRKILDYLATNEPTKSEFEGLLFYSSSEIYGDPDSAHIPTPEDYRGNVSCVGPRACYDESKRFGETLCEIFAQTRNVPISVARPFNNYGPGMSLHDKRVPADFARAVFEGRNIEIFSDGSPTRTFCYIADAITGYLKVMLHQPFDAFNIGIDKPEVSIRDLAEIYRVAGSATLGYTGEVKLSPPPDADYLTDNPNRRCPVITKAREMLHFKPTIYVEEGVERYFKFLKESRGAL